MEEQIATIKNWLGTGSINIFGSPYSGKDTIGVRLAEALGGKFLSSGMILRHNGASDRQLRAQLDSGTITPSDQFYNLVLPYLSREDLAESSLVLGSVGRWSGEEYTVITSARAAGHEIKAAILLNISEAEINNRWEQEQILRDRGDRADDRSLQILATRLQEFQTKTMPVIQTYRDSGLLIPINANQPKKDVFAEVVQKLANFALQAQDQSQEN